MLRPKLNRVWASTSTTRRRDPGDAKYIQGWISEIPTFQVLNYLQWKTDSTILALAERGFFEWGSDVQYVLGSVVWDETDKKIYVSTVGSPDKSKAPSANLTQWAQSSIQISKAGYDALHAAITAHIANVTTNPHKVTASQAGAYSKDEMDAIYANYRKLVNDHAVDFNNPHKVTALQAGAVPSTGGTYTGDVTFSAGVFFDAAKLTGIDKTGGIFLKNANGKIGIDSTGKGIVGTGAGSAIVTEATYPGLKAAQEPSYATPPPVWAMNLMRNICITNGGDGVVTTNFNPAYSPGGQHIIMGSDTQDQIFTQQGAFGGQTTMAVALDVASDTPRNPSDTTAAMIFGTESFYFYYTGASNIVLTLHDATTGAAVAVSYQLTGALGPAYRTVGTYDGTTMRLYLNGILVASRAAGNPRGSNNLYFQVRQKTTALRRNWRLMNARIWQSMVLSDKQVSTL